MTASIDATRASFSRPGTAALYTVQMTPGVRASFRTDATQVEVTVDYVSIAILPEFSVEVDGVPQPKIGMGTLGAQTLVVTTQPTPVPRVVTIVWPVGADVDLLSIGLTGGSQQLLPYSPPPASQRVVCFGDSITQGVFTSEPNDTFPARLARARGWSMINAGFAGHYTVGSDGAAIGALQPTLVVLAIGTNDFSYQTPLPSFVSEYDQWLTNFRAQPGCAEVPIVCVTPTMRSDEADKPILLEDYRYYIRWIVSARGLSDPNLYLLEGWDMVPIDPALFPDGLHLSDAAFEHYARALGMMNLVRNPGFELLRPGQLEGHLWEDLGNSSTSLGSAFSGFQSMRITTGGGRRQRIPGLGAGDCYQLTVKARVEGSTDLGRIVLEFLDAADTLVGSDSANVTSRSWQSIQLRGIAPAGAVQARLVLDKPAGPGAMFVDDCHLPLCQQAYATVLAGCTGRSPTGSLQVMGGRASFGANFTVGFDNPLASQASAVPFLFASFAPSQTLPCGTVMPSAGLAGPGAPGELLLGSPVLGPWIGPTWTPGSVSSVSVPIPADCSYAGTSIFLQGALCEGSFCGLTNAIQVVIGN
ncbi:MAG: SGNH/GDSL hydrolase family protein [Planctomycetota bacterium]